VKYQLSVDSDGDSVATFYADGEVFTVTSADPNFARVAEALLRGEDPRPVMTLELAAKRVDPRFSVTPAARRVTWEGIEVAEPVAEALQRYVREGRDGGGLVRFMERLQANPSPNSREQLFLWLEKQGLRIAPDGRFIGFKGVRSDMTSATAGPAIVDGKAMHGNVPNQPGSVIALERSKVLDDPLQACGSGLHVGTYGYARHFSQVLLEVLVAPEDVVSVPRHEAAKLRCCRYEVVGVHGTRGDVSHLEAPPEWMAEDAEEALSEAVPPRLLRRLLSRLRIGARVTVEADEDEEDA
jgi:hypothetical protein